MNQINKLPSPSPIQEVKITYSVKINGIWHHQDFLQGPQVPAPPAGGSLHQMRRSSDAPKPGLPVPKAPAAAPSKPAPPMTMGRDPSRFLLTFGKFFKENDMRPIAVGLIPERELYDWWESMKEAKDPSPQLEVALEMIEAYLLDIQYAPPAKNKTPRRRP